MKITAIKQQQKRADRYSFYVDGAYAFSLSELALLESGLASGQELDAAGLERYKQLSQDDKLFGRALRYVALRPKSEWELGAYLEKHHSPAPLTKQITNKLKDLDLINDQKFAAAYVHDRLLLRPTSRRRIKLELAKKRVPTDIIDRLLAEQSDADTLQEVIAKKRRQSKYQDDLKLMQYLARQGYNYSDIKDALSGSSNGDGPLL